MLSKDFFFMPENGKAIEYLKSLEIHTDDERKNVQTQLGDCYYYGITTKRDYLKAFEFYKLSENNNSINNIGDCYYLGEGVPQDYRKAIEFYTFTNATHNINQCESKLLEQFALKLHVNDYECAYSLYVKHGHKDTNEVKNKLIQMYTDATHFLPKELSDIVVYFLI